MNMLDNEDTELELYWYNTSSDYLLRKEFAKNNILYYMHYQLT